MADSFTHLHVHTEYSMLDGAARIGEVVAAAAKDGQPALGITDHGNMYGILDFYKECRAQGIKPILGSELYMAHESRFERPSRRGRMDDGGGDAEGGQKLYYHLTALAETDEGYRNLIELSSEAYLSGYHYKPSADFDLLAEHSEGLIVTSGCLGGHVLQALMRDDIEGRAQGGGAVAGHLRARLVLHRDAGPRHPGAAPHQPDAPRAGRAPPGPAPRHQRQPLRPPGRLRGPRRTALRPDGLTDERPRPAQVPRRRALPEAGARDALPVRRDPGGMRQHAVDRRARQRHDRVRQAAAPRLPLAGGLRVRRRLPGAPHDGGRPATVGRWPRRRHRRTPLLRARRDREHGVLVVLPHRVGPHQARARQRHPRRAGSRQRGGLCGGLQPLDHRPRPDRVRPGLRAVPQPEPHLDARHRHGLRLPLPGRDDPLRGREVRARPRRADRDVLHDQGTGRGARRRPRARLPLRPRRQGRQGDAAADHGTRHAAVGLPRPRPEVRGRLQDGRRPPEDAR